MVDAVAEKAFLHGLTNDSNPLEFDKWAILFMESFQRNTTTTAYCQ